MKRSIQENLEYEVIRSSRTTADIVMEPNGRLIVRAPGSVPDERIKEIVKSKSLWIHRNLSEWRDLNATRVLREFQNGENFLYLGRSYRLSLATRQKEPLILKGGRFCLRRDIAEQGIKEAKGAFRNFFIERGRVRLADRVASYGPKVGVVPTAVDVRDLGNRWASCSPGGKLAFHWKCLMAPLSVIDYIVVHELCHLRYQDHGKAFWNEVDKVMPSFKEKKDWLKKYGAGLDL